MKQRKQDTLSTCLCRQATVTSKVQCTFVPWAVHKKTLGSKNTKTAISEIIEYGKRIASENELLKHLQALVDCPDVEQTMIMSVIALLFYMSSRMQKTAFLMIVGCRLQGPALDWQ